MTMQAGSGEISDLIDASQPFSRVDRLSRFDGRYEAMQNLLVEGTCSGEIDCRGTLVVANGAVVNARIVARDVRIAGQVDGEIECSGKFELLPTARASGTVKARQIVVHEGAEYDGELQMITESAAAQQAETREEEPEPPAIAPITSETPLALADREEETLAEEPAPATESLPDFLRPRRD